MVAALSADGRTLTVSGLAPNTTRDIVVTFDVDATADFPGLGMIVRITSLIRKLITWLKLFCRGELADEDFQQRIVDVLINSVYVYDDKIVIYFNVKGGQQVSHIEMLESTEEPPFGGDPLLCNGVRISEGMVGD